MCVDFVIVGDFDEDVGGEYFVYYGEYCQYVQWCVFVGFCDDGVFYVQ